MSSTELPRADVHDVVSVEIAEAELAAVRQLLDDLLDDVADEERAADLAELGLGAQPPLGQPEDEAIELSRQIVEQMRATHGSALHTEVDGARQVAEARVVEASRRAAALTDASRRDAAELLHEVLPSARAAGPAAPPASDAPIAPPAPAPLPGPAEAPIVSHPPPPPVPSQISWRAPEADLPHWLADDEPTAVQPAPAPAPGADASRWTAPLPELQHWAEPAPAALPPEVPLPAPKPGQDAAQAHEHFWREEAQAALARSVGLSPLEVLLPTAALLLLLVAVLVLIR